MPAKDRFGEEDGYVMSLRLDSTAEQSYVAVIDARKFAEGPVARVHFGQVIPLGFHGQWQGTESG